MEIRAPLLPPWLRWIAVAGLAVFIFYVSIVTVPPETVAVVDAGRPPVVPLDKWRHFVAYAALGTALAYATTDWEVDTRLLAVSVVGVTVIYGVGIELGQSFRPNRYYSIGDAYANALGGLLVVPYYLVRPYLEFVPALSLLRSLAD